MNSIKQDITSMKSINSIEYAPKLFGVKTRVLQSKGSFIAIYTIDEKVSLWYMPIIWKIPISQATAPNSSLFSLLKHFNLSQYYDQLISMGFADSNPHIQLLNIKNRRKFTNDLSLMPGHNNRFLRMFSNLEKMFPRQGN